MRPLTIALGALLAAAQLATTQLASAQSAPNIMKPKQAAQRAVAATNAQVTANSTLPEDPATVTGSSQAGARSAATPQRTTIDSAGGSAAVRSSTASPARSLGFERETFSYQSSGRRDPFVSLMTTSELRPLITELKLVAVAFDATGRNSVAILHDLGTKDQYRVRVGQSLGRMRVSHITTKSVVFTIEEFGYSRQETLALGDSNQVRKQ